MVQIWPGTPVAKPLIENDRVIGVQLVDQGTDKQGRPKLVSCRAWTFVLR